MSVKEVIFMIRNRDMRGREKSVAYEANDHQRPFTVEGGR